MGWNKTFKKIELVLGFKLHDWQKDYICMRSDYIPEERACGATTAFILRHLLNYGDKLGKLETFFNPGHHVIPYWCEFPCDMEHADCSYQKGWYPVTVGRLHVQLKAVGIETCFI